MATYVCDIETDGLNATKIWLAACKNIETGFITYCFNKDQFIKLVNEDDTLIGHNFIQFDMYWLNKLWSTNIHPANVIDTYILSSLFNPEREGGHSLAAWGKRFNYPKIEFTNFSSLSPEMVDYCTQDVNLTEKVYQYLTRKEKEDFSNVSIVLEHFVKVIICEQERRGFYLDMQKAHKLMSEVKSEANDILFRIRKEIKPSAKLIREVQPRIKKDGTMSSVGLRQINNVGGSFSLIEFEPFNLGSPKQIVEKMNRFGWKPVEFTPKGQPKITEKNLETVSDSAPEGLKQLARWKMLETRAKTIEGWLDALGDDGRVHGKVFTMGAVTGRMTHAEPNLANIVASYKPFGKEFRECWTVSNPTDYCLVGMDAKGLELRMLAHYMKDDDFIEEVVNGDPHTYNQKAAGLETRNQAKTFIYAFLYGAGPEKIGSIVGGTASDGRDLREKFLKNVPNLQQLVSAVQKSSMRGFIRGLDGRRLWVRSSHASLNTLLQGGGAIACKQWAVFLKKEIDKRNLDAKLVNTIHDEQQYEVHKKDAEELCTVADQTMQQTGKFFKTRVILNADAKVGATWAETH